MTANLQLPDDLFYLIEEQVWVRPHDDSTAEIGITQLGIFLSGEIYMCRPKRIDTEIRQGSTCAVVELAKSIVAVKSAASGRILAINEQLDDKPWLVHKDPYGQGWIARLQLTHWPEDLPQLLHGQQAKTAMTAHARQHKALIVPATAGDYQP